jgi:hypothetical protein
MLKTAKEMFTITSWPSGAGGALYSKFEAPNLILKTKGIKWEG